MPPKKSKKSKKNKRKRENYSSEIVFRKFLPCEKMPCKFLFYSHDYKSAFFCSSLAFCCFSRVLMASFSLLPFRPLLANSALWATTKPAPFIYPFSPLSLSKPREFLEGLETPESDREETNNLSIEEERKRLQFATCTRFQKIRK